MTFEVNGSKNLVKGDNISGGIRKGKTTNPMRRISIHANKALKIVVKCQGEVIDLIPGCQYHYSPR